MTVTARVARLLAPKQLAFDDQPLDSEHLGAEEVFARTLCSAISVGTEIAAWRGDPPLRPGPVYPRLVGYCNVAEVAGAGAAVRGVAAGQRILTAQSHRSAFVCAQEQILAVLPAAADAELATTAYLFHLGHHALTQGGFARGQRVAVVGLGTLGIATVALAALLGAQVDAYSDQAQALALARETGARDARRKSAAGEPADLVITTSNAWADWRLALSLARERGTISVLGFPGRGQPAPAFNPLDSQFFYDRELRLVACGKASPDETKRNCAFILGEIAAGRLPARRLIEAVVPWRELSAAYAALAERRAGPATRVLDWRRD